MARRQAPSWSPAIQNLNDRIKVFVDHFLSLAMLRDNMPVWVEDKIWKQTWRADYEAYAARSTTWQTRSLDLLCNVVVALNEFAEAVRANVTNAYFASVGKFMVVDSLGVTRDGMHAVQYIPDTYVGVDRAQE